MEGMTQQTFWMCKREKKEDNADHFHKKKNTFYQQSYLAKTNNSKIVFVFYK